MTTPFGYFDLLEAFAQPGCAVCRLLEHDVGRFLDSLLYENAVDPTTQTHFRASRGLCHEHTWQLTRYNSALASAILYDAVLDEVARIVERTSPERQNGLARWRGATSPLADALAPQMPCPACVVRDDSEKLYLQVLGEYVSEERLRDAFQRSDGLCLAHFRGTVSRARDPENARLIADVQMNKWAALRRELGEFMHKMDAHYHEQMGAEATSWLRAFARVAGEKGTE